MKTFQTKEELAAEVVRLQAIVEKTPSQCFRDGHQAALDAVKLFRISTGTPYDQAVQLGISQAAMMLEQNQKILGRTVGVTEPEGFLLELADALGASSDDDMTTVTMANSALFEFARRVAA